MKHKLYPTLLASILLGSWAACGPADTVPPGDEAAAQQTETAPVPTETPAQQTEAVSEQAEVEREGEAPPPDVAAVPPDAERTASGLAYKILREGTGDQHPRPGDKVEVIYSGWTTDGQLFGTSLRRNKPGRFPVDAVMPGWSEGMMLMVEGEKRRLWIPQNLAFNGEPNRPEGMLVMDVELLQIQRPISTPEDVSAPPASAQRTDSGLYTRVLERGTGSQHPTLKDFVTVHYAGWTTDGVMFDSSWNRWAPLTMPVDGYIKGWTEGLQLMVKGEKRRMWIPGELAYEGRAGQPQGMVVFDVALLDIKPAPPTPPDLAPIPADAVKTPSGLATKLLKKGTGKVHPSADSRVKVHYSGWTTDGKLFDCSLVRDKPASFQLNAVIPGWTEGLQLMVEGEKRRLWIPEDLAYAGRPGAPQGMLVFDVELLEIESE
jgi:peptidylprolyl isomerase